VVATEEDYSEKVGPDAKKRQKKDHLCSANAIDECATKGDHISSGIPIRDHESTNSGKKNNPIQQLRNILFRKHLLLLGSYHVDISAVSKL
jgi:hypothetical protein